jgi:DNA-binding transcriptional MerR regulator
MKNYKTEIKKDLEKKPVLYKMNEISKKLNVTPRTIRYYESEGLLKNVKRSIGYTRYFTDNDILRLKEVLSLKKSGHKIAEIKDLLSKKYAKVHEGSIKVQCSIDATLIEEKDISQCLNLGIEINDIDLVINNASLNYMDWRDVHDKEFLKPFKIKSKKSTTPPIALPANTSWLGNGIRSIIIDALHRMPSIALNQSYINEQYLNTTEWVFFPVNIQYSATFSASLKGFYYLEKRHQGTSESHVLPLESLLLLLEKQLRHVSSSVNGLLKQVTFHKNPDAKHSDRISRCVESLVLNKDRLAIEDLSPIYMQSLGSNNAYLLSALT